MRELAHDRAEGHFGRCAGGEEGLIPGLQGGIEAYGDERWQVERLAQMGAAAADAALSAAVAGIPGDRREAGEACGAFGLEGPSSGISTGRAKAVASPTPGMLTRISKALAQDRVGGALGVPGGIDRADRAGDLGKTRSDP